jgi:PAS domain S-box-containing protein
VAVSFKDGCLHKAERTAPVGDTVLHVEITSSPIRDSEGNIIAGVELARDITARKQAEEAVRKNEAELKAIIENSPSGITISDIDGHILRTNPAHQRIFGYSLAELQTMTFADFTHPDDIGKNSKSFKKLLVGEIEQLNMTKRFVHKNGHTIWTYVKLSLIPDENNNPLFVVGIVEDITERKKEGMLKDALIEKLLKANEEIKSLKGIVPICMHCKQIRDDKGFWNKVENYIERHTEAKFSHGVCPECQEEYYSDFVEKKK